MQPRRSWGDAVSARPEGDSVSNTDPESTVPPASSGGGAGLRPAGAAGQGRRFRVGVMQLAMEARVTQEAAGPGRFYLGLGVSKIFMRHAGIGEGAKPVAAMKEAAAIVRGVLAGGALDLDGKVFSAHVPPLADDAETPRWDV